MGGSCVANQCACPTAQHACGQRCVANDAPTSCGDSCTPCPGTTNGAATCVAGSCGLACNAGFKLCGGACAPCTTPANAAPACNGAACDFTCNPGFHRCGNQCLPNTSVNSCGFACSACPSANGTPSCDGQRCSLTCNPGTLLCQGACATCATPANAQPSCSGAACDFTCNPGSHRCGNSCLPDTSVNSCGSSCTACPSSNGTASCDGAQCSLACNAGFLLCQSGCAACTTPDFASPVCNGSACDFECYPGYERQGSTCVEVPKWRTLYAVPDEAGRVAFDSARNEVMAFLAATGDTLIWNGSRWTVRRVETSPPPQDDAAMAFDAARGRTYLFGGISNTTSYRGRVWSWNGATWTELPGTSNSLVLTAPAAAYDPVRQRTVAYGDVNGSQRVFEFDGSQWAAIPSTGPGTRWRPGLAFDPRINELLLVGGGGSTTTWSWNGTAWTGRDALPEVSTRAVIAFDPQANVMRLSTNTIPASKTAEWNGTAWVNVIDGPGYTCKLVFDGPRSQMLAVCNTGTWAWNPTSSSWVLLWKLVTPGVTGLSTWDSMRGQTLFFGSDATTWTFDTEWRAHTTTTAPAARGDAAMVWDSVRQRAVLYGGYVSGSSSAQSDTWEWDGAAWSQRTPTANAGTTRQHGMAFDAARGKTVLFGGSRSSTLSNQTWTFDGTTWTRSNPFTAPSARSFPAMTWDSARQRVVLFGGANGTTAYNDLWEWDGLGWTERTIIGTVPPVRRRAALVYDQARARLVLLGGETASGTRLNDAWEFDGTKWVQLTAAQGTAGSVVTGDAVYDTTRRAVISGWRTYGY